MCLAGPCCWMGRTCPSTDATYVYDLLFEQLTEALLGELEL